MPTAIIDGTPLAFAPAWATSISASPARLDQRCTRRSMSSRVWAPTRS
ncbi:hypothetical protein ACFFTM_04450 [Pseudoduganella plicata]|nr:hypothetical protein [Pseudoduganella plicata]